MKILAFLITCKRLQEFVDREGEHVETVEIISQK